MITIKEADKTYCVKKKTYDMDISFMYHALGIREQECTRMRYEGGRIIFEIRTKEDKLYCAKCGSHHVIKSGSTLRCFRCVSVGSRPIILEMTVRRLECKDCGAIQQGEEAEEEDENIEQRDSAD